MARLNFKLLSIVLVVWQAFSILMVAVFNWPPEIFWLNLGLSCLFLLFAETYQSLIFLILYIPFYVVVPGFETLAAWRILFGLLFLVWIIKDKGLRIKDINFLPWDKLLGIFVLLSLLVTLAFGNFFGPGIKQILFWLNIYLFYIVFINTIKTGEQILSAIKAAALSLLVIIFIGYLQLIATFFSGLDTFWVYWASYISKLFYGQDFVNVALYSNSWFSFTVGRELRMFSILPDSHAFALICVFATGFLLPLLYVYSKKIQYGLWSVIRFSGLALVLSGTRAVWVGLLAPLALASLSYWKNLFKPISKKNLGMLLIILLFFALSPFINQGLHILRISAFKENFLDRAFSIYDLRESSNAARLKIWGESSRYAFSHPLGAGVGNFIISSCPSFREGMSYAQVAEVVHPVFNLPCKYITAHNLYLHIFVEAGFLGLAAFLAFLLKFFREIWRFLKQRQAHDNFFVIFVVQSGLTMLWVMAAAFFDVTLFNDRVLMYFLISLGLTGVIIKYRPDINQ